MGAHENRSVNRRGEPVACPFCDHELPRPTMNGPEGAPLEHSGRQCGGCGAFYLLDATGREGGEVLVDGLSLLCGGDLKQAMALQSGIDYELQSRIYDARLHRFDPGRVRRTAYGLAKLWFFRRVGQPTGRS